MLDYPPGSIYFGVQFGGKLIIIGTDCSKWIKAAICGSCAAIDDGEVFEGALGSASCLQKATGTVHGGWLPRQNSAGT